MKYKINKGFIAQKLDNKIVIFDGEESALFNLNRTASLIFNKLKLGWDKEKIIEELMKKYQIKKVKAEKDTNNFISELVKRKIIQTSK